MLNTEAADRIRHPGRHQDHTQLEMDHRRHVLPLHPATHAPLAQYEARKSYRVSPKGSERSVLCGGSVGSVHSRYASQAGMRRVSRGQCVGDREEGMWVVSTCIECQSLPMTSIVSYKIDLCFLRERDD